MKKHHKKDDRTIDEEANHLVEADLRKMNDHKIDIISDQVVQMRNLSKHLGTQLEDQKPILEKLEGGFDRSKTLVYKVMGNMDSMLSRASGSMCPYIVLFTIMILALIYKLS